MTERVDALIIGASAAGLATAAGLRQLGQRFEILESGDVVGRSWRGQYDRLHLHTPKSASALPGLDMPAEWPRYPAARQVIDYLEQYQANHQLTPHFGQQVTRLERQDGEWLATTPSGEWRARTVVVATGANRVPVRPQWPGMESFAGQVLHSSEYRNGDPWRGRPVLVVGFGNSACEQALDLLERGSQPHLAVRSPVNVIPRDVFGLVPILQLGIVMRHLPAGVADVLAGPMIRVTVGDLSTAGLRKLPYGPNTQIARYRQIPMLDIGTMKQLRAGRIGVHTGIERFTADGVLFTDGSSLQVDAVVLATGYRPGLEEFLPDWQQVCDPQGIPRESGRPTALPGLFFCGQFLSPAGMLREIGIESRRIAALIAADH
jgi:indole-3-pyruvate monooxygenase